MRSSYLGQTASSERSPFQNASRKIKASETVGSLSASMEAKGVIPEGRKAWSDHRLHTERVHTDKRRYTSSVRHRDFIKNMTIGALQTDMTLIMVCVITR